MCKLFMLTAPPKLTVKLMRAIQSEVCATDKDGFGYAVLTSRGTIAGERTSNPSRFIPMGPPLTKLHAANIPGVDVDFNQFGELHKALKEQPKALIAHGRFSTNDKGLNNAHPYVSDDGNIALIHNGVVSDAAGQLAESDLKTTNDTEILLRYYERGGVPLIESSVTGYYALGILTRAGLQVIRDDRAMLYVTWISSIQSFAYATTESILKNIATAMGWKIERPLPVSPNVWYQWSGNDITRFKNISPRKDAAPIVDRNVLRGSLGIDWEIDDDSETGRIHELPDAPIYRRKAY